MLSIPHINPQNSYFNVKTHNRQQNTNPQAHNYNIKNNFYLHADTISFSAKTTQDKKEDVSGLIAKYRNRLNDRIYFSDKSIENIKSNVSPKNAPFLAEILKLSNKKLSEENVITILNYIDKPDTSPDEFKEKIDTFKNLKKILTGYGFKQSILAEHLQDISAQGIVDILTTDILLREPKNNFNSFLDSYNNAVKIYDEQIKKMAEAEKKQKLDDFTKHHKASEFMRNHFAPILILSMIFDKSVLNEFVYNRGKYINTVYMPRIRLLEQPDLKFLRRIQTEAVTEKENKGGDIAVYEISLDDKIATLNHLYANREIINSGYEGINFNDYAKPVNTNNEYGNFKIDFQRVKIDLMDKVLRRIGVDGNIVDRYMNNLLQSYKSEPDLKHFRDKFWDINYVHLINAPQNTLLRDIIVAGTEGRFKKLIFEEGPVAETNRKNKEAFEKAGINYEHWLEPTIPPRTQKFTSKNGAKEKIFTVKNWQRNPQESLFDGNYTTCCTGIDKDQGDSFPVFLTNTCTTTLEVRTEKNKVIAMSRILMAKINGKLSMVVENIEVNNKMAKHYLYNDETKYKLRELIFDYARDFAADINNTSKDIPIYFSSKYYKVKDIEKGLKPGVRYENVELIGEFPDKIYVNSYGGRIDKAKLQYVDDGDEFALHLSNITQKNKPVRSNGNDDVESDSNYNYEDKEHYN